MPGSPSTIGSPMVCSPVAGGPSVPGSPMSYQAGSPMVCSPTVSSPAVSAASEALPLGQEPEVALDFLDSGAAPASSDPVGPDAPTDRSGAAAAVAAAAAAAANADLSADYVIADQHAALGSPTTAPMPAAAPGGVRRGRLNSRRKLSAAAHGAGTDGQRQGGDTATESALCGRDPQETDVPLAASSGGQDLDVGAPAAPTRRQQPLLRSRVARMQLPSLRSGDAPASSCSSGAPADLDLLSHAC